MRVLQRSPRNGRRKGLESWDLASPLNDGSLPSVPGEDPPGWEVFQGAPMPPHWFVKAMREGGLSLGFSDGLLRGWIRGYLNSRLQAIDVILEEIVSEIDIKSTEQLRTPLSKTAISESFKNRVARFYEAYGFDGSEKDEASLKAMSSIDYAVRYQRLVEVYLLMKLKDTIKTIMSIYKDSGNTGGLDGIYSLTRTALDTAVNIAYIAGPNDPKAQVERVFAYRLVEIYGLIPTQERGYRFTQLLGNLNDSSNSGFLKWVMPKMENGDEFTFKDLPDKVQEYVKALCGERIDALGIDTRIKTTAAGERITKVGSVPVVPTTRLMLDDVKKSGLLPADLFRALEDFWATGSGSVHPDLMQTITVGQDPTNYFKLEPTLVATVSMGLALKAIAGVSSVPDLGTVILDRCVGDIQKLMPTVTMKFVSNITRSVMSRRPKVFGR